MQSSSEQPLVGEEHCVTTRITAAKETNRSGALHRTEETRPAPTEPVPDGEESEGEEEGPYVAEASIIKTRLQFRRELEL